MNKHLFSQCNQLSYSLIGPRAHNANNIYFCIEKVNDNWHKKHLKRLFLLMFSNESKSNDIIPNFCVLDNVNQLKILGNHAAEIICLKLKVYFNLQLNDHIHARTNKPLEECGIYQCISSPKYSAGNWQIIKNNNASFFAFFVFFAASTYFICSVLL